MENIGRFSARDRADLFRASAAKRRVTPAIIEKDFWVCWTLQRLFTLDEAPAHLLFKGGTSLSKVYNAIERFSEDIDLSLNRADLGFGGDADPASAMSGKRRKQSLEQLIETCRRVVREEMLPILEQSFVQALDGSPGNNWRLTLANDDPDFQTLLFEYPPAIEGGFGYVRPNVRLEFGARSDHWPAADAIVAPYAALDFPDVFTTRECKVRALSAERTFWEKATILHAWYHAPADKVLRDRQSRHYYDVVRLFENGPGKAAIKDLGLLEEVAKHKSIFFASGSAHYGEARAGTLRLVPPNSRRNELRRDYESMREMFFSSPPPFEHVLEILATIEADVNSGGV